jgi:hypothetical protein
MNSQNPVENNGRVAYYGINGVPTATIDGDIPDGPSFGYPGGPHGYTQALIDQYAAIPSSFNITMSHRISDDEDSIYVDMIIEATEVVSGALVGQMVVVEKHINFTSPPGTNGEKNFNDVMKKMLPNHYGTALPGTFGPGDYVILQGAWELANVYDIAQLGVVGFIQDNTTKDVKQAANSTTDPLVPLYDNEVNLSEVSGISATNCLGTVNPGIVIRNQGAEPLTSLDINYRVNDGEISTYQWTGNLDFLESEVVTLPTVSFDLQDENEFRAFTVNPNGVPDEYMKNDTMVKPFDHAPITPITVKLMIRTDNNPEETTWEIVNSAGDVQFSGGPYTNPNTMIQQTFEMEDVECYIFRIFDSGGDGLIAPGFYALYYGSGTYIKNGTTFGTVDSAYFEVNTQVGIAENPVETEISIYPNPATSSVNLDFFLWESSAVNVSVYDLAGRQVSFLDYGKLQAGNQSIRMERGELQPGLYLIQTLIDGKKYTKKLTIR